MKRMSSYFALLGYLLVICTGSCTAQAAGGLGGAKTGINYVPVAFPQILQINSSSSSAVALGGFDPNGNTLTYSIVNQPTSGTISSFNPITGQLSYIPASGFSTEDTFAFAVNNGTTTSEAATVTVLAPSDYAITAQPGQQTSITVPAGQSAVYNLQVTASGLFSGVVSLTCSGAPNLATCNPNTPNLLANPGTIPFSVQVGTTAATAASVHTSPAHKIAYTLCFGGLGLFFLHRRKGRVWPQLISFLAITLMASGGLSGCSSNQTQATSASKPGTPAGTYTLTVQGTSGNVNHSIALIIKVI